MNLAMKYEEIYPPSYREMEFHAKTKLELSDYKKYELEVLVKLNANLHIQTASTLIDSLLKNETKEILLHSYYLLELAYIDKKMLQEYSPEVICHSIKNIMQPSSDSSL